MTPGDYLISRLRSEMFEGQRHTTCRDIGRLAGGYLASGSINNSHVQFLRELVIELWGSRDEAEKTWDEAVEFGRKEPVVWGASTAKHDRVLDWGDSINDDYVVSDPTWVESIDVEEPEVWDAVGQVRTYLNLLFEPDECVGYVVDARKTDDGKYIPGSRGCYTRTCKQLLEELDHYKEFAPVFGDTVPDAGAWVRFNPLDGHGVKDANVTEFRYALVESDSLPIEQQRGIYEKIELPIAVLVNSGNKSLHAIVKIDADSLEEYRRRVDMLYQVCERNNLKVDTANKNPSRLSRLPGVMRGDKKQFIVSHAIGKKNWSEWESWIEGINDDLPDLECLSAQWDNLPALAEPLIDGVLRQGHKMLLSGASKGGKSFLLIELCAAIVEGRRWLGWQCTQGRVLYVNLELDRASCLHRFKAVYEALGWQPNGIANIDVWNLRGQAVPMDRLAPKLIRRAAKNKYSAIVIDPIYKVITGDENAADKMAHFCNQFDLVCHKLAAAVIYCHHHSKGSQGGKRSMDRASGSGVFARDPDALIDMIELVVTEEHRNKLHEDAMREVITGTLNAERPGWGEPGSTSDLKATAVKLLGQDRHNKLLEQCDRRCSEISAWSAWRIDATLREYAKSRPRNCWFKHPIHEIEDIGGPLSDADTAGEEPPWKRGKRAMGAQKKVLETMAEMTKAFNEHCEGDSASVKEIAKSLVTTEKTVRNRVAEFKDAWVIEKGRLKPKTNGEPF